MRPIILVLALLSLWLPSAHALAAGRSVRIETVDSETPNGKDAAALLVNGEVVARIAKEQRGHSPMYNVSLAAALLADAYRKGRVELAVKSTDQTGGRQALFLNGELLLLATENEGKAWGVSAADLAASWRDKLQSALKLEPGTASLPANPAAETPVLSPAPLQPQQHTPERSGTLDFGTRTGSHAPEYSGITGLGGQNVYSPPEFTELREAQLPSELTAQVTGRKLSQREAERSVESAIRCHAGLPSGAQLSWKCAELYEEGFSLGPGKSKRIEVSYAISGGGVADRSGKLSVLLENRSLSTPKESLTFFSNDPEGVKQKQLLYYAELPAGKSGRLVLHHQNQSSAELQIVARVVNTGSSPAALHVIEGMSPPNINTFYIGFKSAEEFWNNLNSGTGRVLAIAPGQQALIASQKLPKGYTSSGYFKLSNLGSGPLLVETLAVSPGAKLPDGAWNERSGASSGVFPEPHIVRTYEYASEDPWLYMRLGDEKPGSSSDDTILHGCYGVTHSFNVELTNDSAAPLLYFVVLRASAGEVKGQFYIDDEYLVTPLVSGGEEFLLKEIPMRPGQTRLLKIAAIPLNGGFYPASIIVRQSRYP